MDFSQLKRISIHARKSLAGMQHHPKPPAAPASFMDFWNALPDFLKARDLKTLARAMLAARDKGKPVLWMMGAHSIKVGLSPWIVRAMREGHIAALAVNGACLVHDFELAYAGSTSEDVAESLVDGSFGMTEETARHLNAWIREAADSNRGLGETVAGRLFDSGFPHRELSLFAAAHELGIPVTVHVAIGCDVIHHHPEASGEAIGKATLADFHQCCEIVSRIGDGGVVLNVGSNVILPEVFLKALTVARNLCGPIHNFTTANLDMIQHYRPNENVVKRPVLGGGTGLSITGHHEITIPLLLTALTELSRETG